MESPTTEIENLIERVETYSKTTLELAKLHTLQTTATVVTSLIWRLSVSVIFLLFLLILSAGIAMLVGDLLGKSYYGFFIVAGFYLLAGILLRFFLRSWIDKPFSKLIITEALQEL